MSLDYSRGCVNFRDVGEWVNLLSGSVLLPVGRLFRGGKLDSVTDPATIGHPGTIVTLRKGPNPPALGFGAEVLHFPISNDSEKYDTTDPVVRRWLREVVGCLGHPERQFPVLFHCTSGKDRTGVVIAALSAVLGVPRPVIVGEYLLSDGEVRAEWIAGTLDGIGDPEHYFRGAALDLIRQHFAPDTDLDK